MNTYSNAQYILQSKSKCISHLMEIHIYYKNTIIEQKIIWSSSEKQATRQGYWKIRLIRSLKKFIFRYQDLVEIYSVSAEKIINDEFSYSENL